MPTTVASLQALLDLDKRGFDKGLNSASGLLDKFSHHITGKLTDLAQAGLKAFGAAIVDSVNKAADLESQLDTIGAISGATEAQIAGLKETVMDLGLDPDLKVSAFEAAQAVEELAAGGVELEDIMNGAARGTVALANATGADYAQAATIAADAMAIFNIRAEDLSKVVDGVTAVVVSSKFDVNDYALALAQAGGVAKGFGVEMDDFNTTMAAIAPLFASGSDAGTSFKTFLQRLVGSTDKAKDTMAELGIITEEQGNRFFDAQGNLKSMAEIAGIMDEAFSGLSEEQRNQAMATIFGTDAMRAALGLMETGKQGITDMQAAMANTSGADAAAQRMTNLKGQMEILMGVVEGLQISFGDKLLPKLTELAMKAQTFAGTDGPAFVDSLANIATKIISFGEVAVPIIFQELADAFGGIGTNLEKLNAAFDKTVKLLGLADEKGEKLSLTTQALNTFMGALTQPIDLLNTVLGFMLDNFNSSLDALNRVKQAMTGLGNSTQKVSDRIYELGAALADLALPDWLTPGSPTPFELGLWGIGDAIKAMPTLDLTPAMNTAPVNTGGGGDTFSSTTLNMGGQSFQFGGANSKDQALLQVMRMLRQQIEATA